MGYRSDVALALSEEAVKQFEEMRKTLTVEQQEDLDILLKTDTVRHESGARLYYWEWIKWYDEYQSVSIINDFIKFLENRESYLFILLGEDINDNEVKGAYYDNPFELTFRRQITYKE